MKLKEKAMGEIKFRAWNVLDKKMLDWGDIFHLPAWEIFPGTPEQRPFNIMQYTGMEDKNGREIYEGDVVKFISRLDDSKRMGTVRYWAGDAAFLIECEREIFFLFHDALNREVIGNIYENPEILKDTK